MSLAAAKNKGPECTAMQLYQLTRARDAGKAEKKQYLIIYDRFIGERNNAAPQTPSGGGIPRML